MKQLLKIKYWRKKRKYSQGELSAMIGISQGYLSKIELHKKPLTVDTLYSIATALEVCPKALLLCEYEDCTNCTKEAEK